MIQKRGAMELTSFGMSMYPLIREGDASRFVRVRARDLEVGDVCLFVSGSGILTGHRLVEIRGEGAGRQYVFRGDTSYVADDPVGPEAILGLWTGVRRARRGGGAGVARIAAAGAGAAKEAAADAAGARAAEGAGAAVGAGTARSAESEADADDARAAKGAVAAVGAGAARSAESEAYADGARAAKGAVAAVGAAGAAPSGTGSRAAEFGGKWITPKHWQARLLRWLVLHYPLTRKFTRKLGTWSMSRKPMYRAASR
ncbi:hypothetical protein B8V81_3259 [Paenibacillus pasadenensis]|uniref:Signal peptidase I n=1 Tax=Paenibacillus pasadenensis TaxID=217090 RepID=A0A2N5N3B0_9BACL|nr:hypothetical protein B8V81_3259 [Paenibacillus pasadenensis]